MGQDTKRQLAQSMKKLLRKSSIEKITIQELVELAGVIRPTFYHHFRDKYELLEYIIREDLLVPIKPLLVNDMVIEGLTLLFSNIKKERDFYSQAIRIEGQNSFESIAVQEVKKLLLEVTEELFGRNHYRYVWLSRDVIAEYYAQSMCYVAITWIKQDYMIEPRELSEVYDYLTKHSMVDIWKEFG